MTSEEMDYEKIVRRGYLESSDVKSSWVKSSFRKGAFWILFPFVLSLLWFVVLRNSETFRGLEKLKATSVLVSQAMENDELGDGNSIVDSIAKTAAYSPAVETSDLKNYRRLVRVIYDELSASPDGPENYISDFDNRVARRIYIQTYGICFIQSAICMFFPGLLITSLWKSRTKVLSYCSESRIVFSSFNEAIQFAHFHWLLDNEKNMHVWHRGLFAWMIAMILAYFFSPGGFVNTTAVAYMYLFAPASEPSMSEWFNQYSAIPAALAGFSGFLIYSFMTFRNQYQIGTLSYRTLIPLVYRGLTIGIICVLIGVISEYGAISILAAFTAGIFPQSGINMLTNIVSDNFKIDDNSEFTPIPEIDYWKENALGNAGIHSIHDFAKSDVLELAIITGMNPRVLVDSIDRALLLHCVGVKYVEDLAGIPLFRASQFVDYLDLKDSDVVARIAEIGDFSVLLSQLKNDSNLALVQDLRETYKNV